MTTNEQMALVVTSVLVTAARGVLLTITDPAVDPQLGVIEEQLTTAATTLLDLVSPPTTSPPTSPPAIPHAAAAPQAQTAGQPLRPRRR